MLVQRLLNQIEDSSWNSQKCQCPVGKSSKTLQTFQKNHPKQSKNLPDLPNLPNLRQMQLPCVAWAAFKGAGDSPPQAAHSRGGPVSRLHIGSLAPRSDSVLVALGWYVMWQTQFYILMCDSAGNFQVMKGTANSAASVNWMRIYGSGHMTWFAKRPSTCEFAKQGLATPHGWAWQPNENPLSRPVHLEVHPMLRNKTSPKSAQSTKNQIKALLTILMIKALRGSLIPGSQRKQVNLSRSRSPEGERKLCVTDHPKCQLFKAIRINTRITITVIKQMDKQFHWRCISIILYNIYIYRYVCVWAWVWHVLWDIGFTAISCVGIPN